MRTEFTIQFLQYFPDIHSERHINLALTLRSREKDVYEVRLIRNWRVVRAFDACADLPMLEAMAATFQKEIAAGNADAFLKLIAGAESAVRLSIEQPYVCPLTLEQAADAACIEHLHA